MRKFKKLLAIVLCTAMAVTAIPAITASAETVTETLSETLQYYGTQYGSYTGYALTNTYTGELMIDFDLKVKNLTDGVIAFTSSSGVFGPEAIAIHTNPDNGFFCKNGKGDTTGTNETLLPAASVDKSKTYHFHITASLTEHNWNCTLSEGDTDIKTLSDLGFRTNQDTITRINMIRNTELYEYVDDIAVTNMTLSGDGTAPKTFTGTCGKNGDNLTWELTPNGVLTISGEGEMTNYMYTSLLGVPIPPWLSSSVTTEIKKIIIEDGVTSIGEFAFYGCSGITDVTFGNTLTDIGYSAFRSSSIKSVRLPASVKNIGDGAFGYCSYLTDISVDDGNEAYIDVNGVLYTKDMKKLVSYPDNRSGVTYTIPDGVVELGGTSFGNSKNLGEIRLPASLTSISSASSMKGGYLKKIIVNSENPSYTDIDGVLFSKDREELILFPKNHGKSYNIPEGTVTVGADAFSLCDALTKVTFPKTVTVIKHDAFYGCSNLENLALSEGLVSIDAYAFAYCDALARVVIPDSVTTLGNNAFYWCDSLQTIQLGLGVRSIGDNCFYSGYSYDAKADVLYGGSEASYRNISKDDLHSLIDDNYVHYFTDKSERINGPIKCYGVQSPVWPYYTRHMRYAYQGNVKISFDLKVNSFGDCIIDFTSQEDRPNGPDIYSAQAIVIYTKNTFSTVRGLENGGSENVDFYGSPVIGEIYHFDITTDTYKHIWSGVMTTPDGKKITVADNYLYKTNYDYIDKLVMLRNTSELSFVDDLEITNFEISMDETVDGIGGPCGAEGDNLMYNLKTDGTLVVSGQGAMANFADPNNAASGLAPWYNHSADIKKVILEDGVTTVGTYAFKDCKEISDIDFGNTLQVIMPYSFHGCSKVTEVNLPDTLEIIRNDAFYGCEGLTEFTVPKSVTTFEKYVLNNCPNIKHIDVAPGNAKYVSVDGILYNSEMTSLIHYPVASTRSSFNIPSTVNDISAWIFEHNRHLQYVSIPEGVTRLENGVFSDCTALRTVSLPAGFTTVNNFTFRNCISLGDIYFAGTSTDWMKLAIGSDNTLFSKAKVHYNTDGPKPAIKNMTNYTENGMFYVNACLENIPDEATAFIVAVDSEGKTVLAPMKAGEVSLAVENDIKFVKAFVWESLSTLRPLASSVEQKISSERLEIKSVKASQEPQADNAAKNLIDGNINSVWACKGNGNIVADLGDEQSLSRIDLYVNKYDDNRSLPITIEVSKDNATWKKVWSGAIGSVDSYNYKVYTNEAARYIRITCNGSTTNDWASLAELEVFI